MWETKTLEKIAYIAGRIGWKGLTAKEYTEVGPYFLSVHSLNYGDFVDFRDAFHISDARYDESPEIMIEPNDILICKDGAGIGKLGIIKDIPGPTTINSSLLLIRPLSEVEPKFLYYKLCSPSFQKIVQERIEGATTPHLYQREIKQFLISLPLVPEQKRIVAILDQAFADIDKARANTEKNLKNARELFESYLQKVFIQSGEGWEKIALGQVTGGVYTGPFGSLLHKSDYIENGIPLVNPAHITSTGIEADNRKTVSQETAQRLSGYIMREGDIVIGRRGEMGRCALISDKEEGFLCGTGSFFIKSSDRCYGEYLIGYLRSAVCKARLEKISGGAVMPNLSNKDLSNLNLYLPPYGKQKEIAEAMADISRQIENVATVYQKKLESLDELKKSVLQKAFSGELINAHNKSESKGVAA